MNFEEKIKNAKNVLGSSQGKGYLSDFWRKILDNRNNFPDGDALREFFRLDYAKGYGTILGDTPEKTFRMLVDTFVKDTPKDFLLEFIEPDFGNPQKFNYQDLNFSITYLQNIPTTYRIQCLPLGKQLRVLEIGAGYGGVAQQLHQILDIKKYTIIDLPESLYMSYFYLSENTGRKCAFAVQEKIDEGFEFVTPDQLDYIDNEFDLVINTISMGEMDLHVVQKYLDLIQDRLSQNGFFFSLNTHGKVGVKKPSQYLIKGFSLFSIYHWIRRVPNSFFNKMHCELVQTRNSGETIDEQLSLKVDRLGTLISMGARMPESESVLCYEKGLKAFCNEQTTNSITYFKKALDSGLTGYAKIVASTIVFLEDRRFFGREDKSHFLDTVGEESPIIRDELENYLKDPVSRKRFYEKVKSHLMHHYA